MRKFLTLFTFSILLSLSGYSQYCIPFDGGNGCTDGDDINDFILWGENGTGLNTPATGCDPSGLAFEDYTSLPAVDLSQSVTYYATVSTDYPFGGENIAIWIDFDDNDAFELSEMVGSYIEVLPSGVQVEINIPLTAPLGLHRMRASNQYNVFPVDMDPCNTFGNASFTESHDYMVNIVGPPSCPSVSDVALGSVSDVSATITWTGTGAPLYSVEYGPAGFTVGTGTYGTTASTSFNINGLSASTPYTAYVRAICSSTDSSSLKVINFSTTCAMVNPPYIQPFDADILYQVPECMTWEDANNDGSGWNTDDWQSFSAPNSLMYYATWNLNADDWIYTPGINMEANYTYQVTFKYKADGFTAEALEVKAGTAPASTSMGPTTYFSNTGITTDVYETASFEMIPTVTGPQYVGFHIFSSAFADYLSLEDINIQKVCGSAQNLTVTNITTVGADITWDPVFSVVGYEYVLDQSSADPTVTGIATTATSYNVIGLVPGATYYFHLRSNCGTDYSAWQTVTFTTNSTTCALPTGVAISGITPYAANANWNTMPGAISYDYKLDQVIAPPASGWTATSSTNYSASGLLPNTLYYFHVRTHCLYGNSGWVTQSFTTGNVVCDTTTNLAATNIISDGADIIWTIVVGASGYEYLLDQTLGDPAGSGTFTSQNTYSATGLLPNTTYYFHLRTDCGSTFSEWIVKAFSTSPVGIENVNGEGGLVSVYPNPATNAVTIEAQQASANAQVQLMDISGRILQTLQLKDKKAVIEMNEMAVGMYLLKYTDNGSSQLIKVMKQ